MVSWAVDHARTKTMTRKEFSIGARLGPAVLTWLDPEFAQFGVSGPFISLRVIKGFLHVGIPSLETPPKNYDPPKNYEAGVITL